MKSKTMILMAVAVVCGLGAAYMSSRLLAEKGQEQTKEEQKIKVLVARKNIAQGTFFKTPEDWFEEKEFKAGEEPKKAVCSFDDVKDRVLSKPLSAEQWVVSDDLLTKAQSGLANSLPKGKRAMSIKVNVDTVVAGFVQANSRVDVINTTRSADKESSSKTILQNMLVLAIDQLNNKDTEKVAIISSTVTLAVTPEEAQALSLAQQLGELRLILRPQDDNEIVKLKRTQAQDIEKAQAKKGPDATEEEQPKGVELTKVPDVPADPVIPTPPADPPAPVEPAKPKKHHVLVVLNGDTQTKATFREGEDDTQTEIRKSSATPEKTPDTDKAQPATTPEKPKRPSGKS